MKIASPAYLIKCFIRCHLHLYLGSNALRAVNISGMHLLNSIYSLSLNNVSLNHIPVNFFKRMNFSLQYADSSYNKLESIENIGINFLFRLDYLRIYYFV